MRTGRIIAVGAWLKNRAYLDHGDHGEWSALHGDLSEWAACSALASSLRTWQSQPELIAIAHDWHPDYDSSLQAQALAAALNLPAIGVQHHHAHIAATMAEHALTGPVLGWALDGQGMGLHGEAWGGELLRVDGAQFTRVHHLPLLALPGGDAAARQPWRLACAAQHQWGVQALPQAWADVDPAHISLIQQWLQRGLHSPSTSSCGRWFDAMAGLLGICPVQTEEAQAARRLEQLACEAWHAPEPVRQADQSARPNGLATDWGDWLCALLQLASSGDGLRLAAAAFHWGLAQHLAETMHHACLVHGIQDVVLSGGCMHNRLLREALSATLRAHGLRVYLPSDCGDSGLARGQAWVARRALPSLP